MDINALARLAKLDLTPDEQAKLQPQLESILAEFNALSTLPTIPLTIQTGEDCHLRQDVVIPTSNETQNALLDSSPYKQANFIRLPSVF